MCKEKRSGQLWNLIRKTKQSEDTTSAIQLEIFEHHFQGKFKKPDLSEFAQAAQVSVDNKIEYIHRNPAGRNFQMSISRVKRYIHALKSGSAAGLDGITSEHLKFGMATKLPYYLSNMLSICVRFGVVPDSFLSGVLIPILKKRNCDPTLAKNYRPVVISATFSKLLEIHLLDISTAYEFSPSQFGFIEQRGTNMAITLAHDVCSYIHAKGSTVYLCSLDAEAAFDGIPHPVLFHKLADVIRPEYWMLLVYWYAKLCVYVKWGNCISNVIPVQCGTRQGGLTSPFIFNVFYKDLIDELSACHNGVSIKGNMFNVYCYADDILISSTSVTGLQCLINKAKRYIKQHGLRFNPSETSCMLFGNNPFDSLPVWTIDGVNLQIESSITYLGAELSPHGGNKHTESRIRSTQRAFYSLQGAGLNKDGV